MLTFVATFACGAFFGAAVYISLAQLPATLEVGGEFAGRFFGPMYRRAARVQAPLAVVGTVMAILAWLTGSGLAWLVGGLLLFAVMPLTYIRIMPINNQLLDTRSCGRRARYRAASSTMGAASRGSKRTERARVCHFPGKTGIHLAWRRQEAVASTALPIDWSAGVVVRGASRSGRCPPSCEIESRGLRDAVVAKEETSKLRHDWPLWVPFIQTAGLILFHGVLPFGLSRLSYRHGWFTGQPQPWNLAGLLPVASGIAVIIWVIVLHRERAPRHGWRVEKTPFEPPRYLIVNGPYRYSRNPIYLSHLAIWTGWTLFYGSVAMMLGVLFLWTLLAFVIVPYEERGLARTLGESYVQYQSQVARWFGRLSAT